MFEIKENNTDERLTVDTEKYITNTYVKEGLLHINRVQNGEEFCGTCYCTRVYPSRDLYDNTKWSATFHLVDAEGVKFKATIYGCCNEPLDTRGPVMIKGVKRLRADYLGNDNIDYRLLSVVQSTVNCDKSYFMAYMENYNEAKETFLNNVKNLINMPSYIVFLNQLESYNILDTIMTETFADNYGTKMGLRMEAFNKGCSMIYTLLPDSYEKSQLCYLALLLKLWQPEVRIENITLESTSNDNILTKRLILTSNLTELEKIKIIDCLEKGTRSLEGKIINNVYNTIADLYALNDKLKTKQVGTIGLLY